MTHVFDEFFDLCPFWFLAQLFRLLREGAGGSPGTVGR